MADLTLRSVKGTPLTYAEVDGNFTALNADVLRVATIAAMEAILVPTNGQSVEVTEKGRGGLFVFDTSLGPDPGDGGTTFKPGDATSGSWARRYSGAVNVLWFGTNTTPGTTDMTPFIQAAIDLVYAQGGGDVFIPKGTYGVTAITKEFAFKRLNVNIIGEGRSATKLQKIGATTTPIIHFYATGTGPIDTYSTMQKFQVSGLANHPTTPVSHDGIRLTRLAKHDLRDVEIINCDVGFDNIGTQIFNAYNVALSSNFTGYRARVGAAIYANAVNFFGGEATNNTSFGFDIGSSSGTHLEGVFIYQNGTTTDLATGSIIWRGTVDDEYGGSIQVVNNCFIEKSDGMCLRAEAASGMHLTVRNTELINNENGKVADIGVIRSLTLDNVVALTGGDNPDTVTSAALRTLIKGGVIHTYVDNSSTTTINHQSATVTTVYTGPSIRVDEVFADEKVYIKEAAAAGTPLTTWGQLWVENTTPQRLWFTDEAGTDKPLIIADEVVTAETNVITAAESGKTFFLNRPAGITSTLPAPALGLKYTFIVSGAPTSGNYIIATNGGDNILYGTFLDVVGELEWFWGQDTMNLVSGAAKAGDRIEMVSDGVWWHITARSGADGGITVSVT